MPVPHRMFSAGRCVFWCPLAGAESDFCGRNGGWKGLIFRHNRVLVQNQGTVLKKSSHRGVHPGHFPSREGPNERRPISCAHSSWIKRSTLLCRKMTWVHPVVSFPLIYMVLHVSRIRSTSIPPENPLYRGMLRRSRCVLIFSLKYPCMTINDIIQYASVHFTIYPRPYSCMSRWYYYRQ